MSRTFLVNDTASFSSTQHEINEAVLRAAKGSDIKNGVTLTPEQITKLRFDFDLFEVTKDITSERMREELLTKLAWSCDGLISAQLNSCLIDYYKSTPEDECVHPWDSYQSFLLYVAGLEHTNETLTNMGIDVANTQRKLRNLYSIRTAAHDAIADSKYKYDAPLLEDFIGKPRARSTSNDTLLKTKEMAQDEAGGDKDLENEIYDRELSKLKGEALSALEWDKKRAPAALMLLHAFKLTDLDHFVGDDSRVWAPFQDLDALTQFKLLNGVMRALDKFDSDVRKDMKIDIVEYKKIRAELKAHRAAVEKALANPRFDEARETI